MQEERFHPRPEFRAKLEAVTPNAYDFVLYCKHCEWIGTPNAAHADASRCPQCGGMTRIWKKS